MKKRAAMVLSVIVMVSVLSQPMSVSAAQPNGYWPYFTAYTGAVESGNVDKVLAAGDALLAFYSRFDINRDIAEMSYNIYYYRYQNLLFEKRGDYAAAIANAKKLVYYADYLGFTDMSIAASARAKKLDPMTEVYALSHNAASGTYYGAKHEPECGTYYGRVVHGYGASKDGTNRSELSGEAIASVYVELGRETAGDFSWIIGGLDDGAHLIHVALNFPGEAGTAAEINSGIHDDNIRATLGYLATLKSPVFLRIGAEMNLWEMDPAVFKDAYTRVAKLARSLAPEAALVWSPNFVGYWGSDVADYYPGDAYVDWVGVSLYTNSAVTSGQTDYSDGSMYFGGGAFADCVLSMRELADFAQSHNKPAMVTEGGTGIINNATGASYESEAVSQIAKMYSSLNMVYPNVKGIIYFDTDPDVGSYKYAMSNSSAVSAAYQSAVSSNPTLISKAGAAAASYVKLADFGEKAGSVSISAYSDTLCSDNMTVTYYLAGSKVSSDSTLPYGCTLDISPLAAGNHKFEAVFNDGAGYTKTKTYTLTKLMDGSVSFAEGYDASAAPDVPSVWAQEEVGLAIGLNLVPETLRGNYTADISRIDFCTLIVRLIEQKTGKGIDAVLSDHGVSPDAGAFSDTSGKDVLAAYALGILDGRDDGTFDGDSGITREEAAKMLKNAADVLHIASGGGKADFTDVSSFSSWAVEGIAFASSASDKTSGKLVMGGVDDGRFNPHGTYTYEQAFLTMLRLYRA